MAWSSAIRNIICIFSLIGLICGSSYTSVFAGQMYTLSEFRAYVTVGTTWIYSGTDWDGMSSDTRIQIVSTQKAITSYTDGASATPYSATVIDFQNDYGTASDDHAFISSDQWDEYFTTTGGIHLWGHDDGGESIRVDGGLNFGEIITQEEVNYDSAPAYLNGSLIGNVNMQVSLLEVVDVTVPAGTFHDCLHLRFIATGVMNQTWDEWRAQGVGMVKFQGVSGDGSARTRALTWMNFTPDVEEDPDSPIIPESAAVFQPVITLLLQESTVDDEPDEEDTEEGDESNGDGTVTSITGQVWMDRNLGTSRVAQSYDDEAAYGDLYQWGRGTDGHEKRDSETTTTLSTSDDPGHGQSIISSSNNLDWRSPQNDDLWQGLSGANNPCPVGFRLPTRVEFEEEVATWSSNDEAGSFKSKLKICVLGTRDK
nr:FISUMP domain-containing protein [uncultured Desulfobulbus sp.]